MENLNKPHRVRSSYCDLGLQSFYSAEKFAYETIASHQPQATVATAVHPAAVAVEHKSVINASHGEVLSAQELAHRVQRIASKSVRPVVVDGKLFFVPCGEDVDVVTAVQSNSQMSLLSEATAISSADGTANVKSMLKLLGNLKTYLGDANYARFLEFSKDALAIDGDETCESVLLQELNAFAGQPSSRQSLVSAARQSNSVATAIDSEAPASKVTATDSATGLTLTAVEKPSVENLHADHGSASDAHCKMTSEDVHTAIESASLHMTVEVAGGDLRTAIESASGHLHAADNAVSDLHTAIKSDNDLRTAVEVASGSSGGGHQHDDGQEENGPEEGVRFEPFSPADIQAFEAGRCAVL